jgi:hypothetical protein
MLAGDKQSSLLRTFANYGRIKFYNIDTLCQFLKLFSLFMIERQMKQEAFPAWSNVCWLCQGPKL